MPCDQSQKHDTFLLWNRNKVRMIGILASPFSFPGLFIQPCVYGCRIPQEKMMSHTVTYTRNQTCQYSSHDWRDDTGFNSTPLVLDSTWDQLPSPKGSIWPGVTPASGVLKLSFDFHGYCIYVQAPPLYRHTLREIIKNKIL